jgi:hypothetical protein
LPLSLLRLILRRTLHRLLGEHEGATGDAQNNYRN